MSTSQIQSSSGLFFHFLKLQKAKVILLIIICALIGSMPAIDSILLRNITNTIENFASGMNKDQIQSQLLFWAIIYGLWWECLNVVWRLYDYIYLKTTPYIKQAILDELYNYTQYNTHKFFQDNMAGQITTRITESARSFEMAFSILGEKIVRKIFVMIFSLFTLYSVNHIFANILLIWMCIFVGLGIVFSKTINIYSTTYARSKNIIAGKIVDAISNISSVRMFNSHQFERRYINTYIDSSITDEQKMQWFMLKLHYVLGLSCSVMIFFMLYYMSILLADGTIDIGICILSITLCVAVSGDIWDLTQEIGDLFEEIGAFNQGVSLIKPYIIADQEDASILQVTNGEIKFDNVTFGYSQSRPLFQNRSITIAPKQKVGLVGLSGSGKSSFISLIARLYDVSSGEILIDGQNIQNCTQESLRDNITTIPQESILFHRTIMENIRYGKLSSTDEEVIEAAKKAHVHEFILTLPEGYNTLCGERGNNLSGGQRQRILIARAVLKNAPILILDEATSALDSTTEQLIQESLAYLMQNKTVIVIAHKLSTLLNMDRILTLEYGNILEDGTHEELIQQKGLYYKLWNSQVQGFIV